MAGAVDFVFLDWSRCNRGYELSLPTEAEKTDFKNAEPYIRPLSEAHTVFDVMAEISRSGTNVVERIVNARTHQEVVNFHNEFGPLTFFGDVRPGFIPAAEEAADRKIFWMTGTQLSMWECHRLEFCRALDQIRDGKIGRDRMDDVDILFWMNDIGSATAKLIPVSGKNRPQLRFNVKSLRGLVWLQIANTISEGGQVINCPVCGNYMIVGKTGSNSNSGTCSIRCRKALSRKSAEQKHRQIL